ncbi:MAG: response regulator [Acidobacteriia bacterium]|nr:response regulator [Terriglobia bacterium]
MATGPPAPRKQLLVVDDDPMVHDFVGHALRSLPVEIVSCETAGEGLRQIAERSFDLILLDLGLPDINGLEVLARLRQMGGAFRVIVITADDTPESLLRAIRQNTYDYLRKPFTAPELAELVTRALSAKTDPAIEVVSAKREWVELSIPCTRDSAERIEHFVRQLDADLGLELMEPVAQAFRELLMNAVEWGGGLDPSRRVRLACLRTPRMLFYRIADPGPGFRFEGLTHAAVSNPAGALASDAVREAKGIRPGGLGLAMVQALADEMLYNEAQNEVVLVKYLA